LNFLTPDDIRIKGHRIGIARLAAWREQRYREWATNPSPVIQRLRALKTQHEAARVTVG